MRSNNSSSWGLLRLPKYYIRSSQNDPFHFDLWNKGINILRDGGSFSYNANNNMINYFSGIKSHNSLEFKENQMIRYGRFLLGNKIIFKNNFFKEVKNNYSKFFTDYSFNKNSHAREIIHKAKDNSWEIIDSFRSSINQITLRWRVVPSDWEKVNNFEFHSSLASLSIFTQNNIISCNLVEGIESRNYGKIQKIPVIEVIVSGYEGKIKTVLNLS